METKKLYKILDRSLPKQCCYTLRKIRNTFVWRVRVWRKDSLDKQGILASYVQDVLYPLHTEIDDLKADFLQICKVAIKRA